MNDPALFGLNGANPSTGKPIIVAYTAAKTAWVLEKHTDAELAELCFAEFTHVVQSIR